MPKMRIHEIAKQWNIDSKTLIKGLKDIGVSVSSHQSIISEEDVLRLRASIDGQSPSSSDSAGGIVRKSTLIRRAGDGGSDVKVIRRRRGGSQDSPDEQETSQEKRFNPPKLTYQSWKQWLNNPLIFLCLLQSKKMNLSA